MSDRIGSAIGRFLARRSGGYGARARALNRTAAVVALAAAAAVAAPAAATVTVAALGDSLTAGYGLPPGEGFVPRLEAWLRDHGADVQVQNAGVSGDTTAGGLARLDWTLASGVDALIVALGGNDVLRGLDPAEARANLDAILARADEAEVPVLLVGIDVPGNYGAEYEAEFEAIWPDLARVHGALFYPDFFGPLSALPNRARAIGDYILPDGLHPNAAGVALIVEAMAPVVLDLIDRAD